MFDNANIHFIQIQLVHITEFWDAFPRYLMVLLYGDE